METTDVARTAGFIDAKTGRLKSREELEPLDSPRKQQNSTTAEQPSSDVSVRSALLGVRSKTSAQINSAAEVVGRDRDNLKAAKNNLKALRNTARDLKQAIKSGDNETETALREQFQQLQNERDDIAERVTADNRELAPRRRQGIRSGNTTRATIETRAVKLETSKSVDTSSVRGLNSFLEESKTELDAIQTQLDTNRASRSQLREINRELRSELNEIADSSERQQGDASIESLSEAQDVATRVATQIGAQQTLEIESISSVDSVVAERLLGAS